MHGSFGRTDGKPKDRWHPLDPSLVLCPSDHEHRVYADDQAALWVVVDAEDYSHFSRWRWQPCWDRTGRKLYLRRTVAGRHIYLHKEILRRAKGEPPTPGHHIADHRNGMERDCRRANLRWATVSMNRRNRYGAAMQELGYDETPLAASARIELDRTCEL
jgi:hypothetical protein